MMGQVTDIDWDKFHIALPAFLTILVMPFTYSIVNGIGVGVIAFTVMNLFAGKGAKTHWIMWLLTGLFIIFFAIEPLRAVVG